MEHFYQNIQGWFNYHKLYSFIIKELPYNSHMIEIGAWKGASTAYLTVEIINSEKNIKLDVVDTWKGSDDPSRGNYINDLRDNNGDMLIAFIKNMEPVKHLINPIHLDSVEAAKLYDDKSLDFVFIDGNHDKYYVEADINAYLPKIKNSGWIGGHDYNHPALPGVTEVVNNVFKERVITFKGTFDPEYPNNQLVDFNTDSWLVRV